jgi:hypothetical protein
MGIKVIIKVTFEEEATGEQLSEFCSVMKKDGWVKVSGIENSWKATFKDGVTEAGALNVVKHDVDRASKKAKMYKYKLMVQMDEDVLEPFDNF